MPDSNCGMEVLQTLVYHLLRRLKGTKHDRQQPTARRQILLAYGEPGIWYSRRNASRRSDMPHRS